MFDSLSERLEGAFKTLEGEQQTHRYQHRPVGQRDSPALVAADVNYKIAEFTDNVKTKPYQENVLKSVKPGLN